MQVCRSAVETPAYRRQGLTRMRREALAARIRLGVGLDEMSSPFAYAQRMHLDIIPCPRASKGAKLVGRTVYWDPDLPRHQQRAAVAREACRWVLRTRADDDSDAESEALAAAVFGPIFSASEPDSSAARRAVLCELRPLRQAERKDGASRPARLGLRSARVSRPR